MDGMDSVGDMSSVDEIHSVDAMASVKGMASEHEPDPGLPQGWDVDSLHSAGQALEADVEHFEALYAALSDRLSHTASNEDGQARDGSGGLAASGSSAGSENLVGPDTFAGGHGD